MISQVLQHIKEQTGLALPEDSYFSGVKAHRGTRYFCIETSDKVCESRVLDKLERLAGYSTLIERVEPSGVKRIAVFLHSDNAA